VISVATNHVGEDGAPFDVSSTVGGRRGTLRSSSEARSWFDAAGFRALDPIPAISPSLLKTSITPVRDSIRQGVSWARDPESDSGGRTCNRILSTTTRMSGVASASRG